MLLLLYLCILFYFSVVIWYSTYAFLLFLTFYSEEEKEVEEKQEKKSRIWRRLSLGESIALEFWFGWIWEQLGVVELRKEEVGGGGGGNTGRIF